MTRRVSGGTQKRRASNTNQKRDKNKCKQAHEYSKWKYCIEKELKNLRERGISLKWKHQQKEVQDLPNGWNNYSISGTMKREITKSDTKRVCITYVDPIEKHNALLPCRLPTERQE